MGFESVGRALDTKIGKVVDFFVGETEVSSSVEPIIADGDENRKEAPLKEPLKETNKSEWVEKHYCPGIMSNTELLRAGVLVPGTYVKADGSEYVIETCPPTPFEKVSRYVMVNGVRMPVDTFGPHRPLPPSLNNAKNENVKGSGDVSPVFINKVRRLLGMRTTTWGHKLSPRK